MKSREKLDNIIDNSISIGNKEFDKYKSSGKKKTAQLCLKAYNTALRAMIVKELQ